MQKLSWILIAIVGLAIVGYGAVRILQQNETGQQVASFETTAAYICAESKLVAAGFSDGLATVVLGDGRVFTLEQTPTASGVRYANEGDAIVFSTKDTRSFVEEDGTMTYRDCILQSEDNEENGKSDNPDAPGDLPGIEGRPKISGETRDSSVKDGCYVGGCSAQICSDEPDAVSTCEFRQAYACYQTATCERQATGKCGWTQTTALKACLSAAE